MSGAPSGWVSPPSPESFVCAVHAWGLGTPLASQTWDKKAYWAGIKGCSASCLPCDTLNRIVNRSESPVPTQPSYKNPDSFLLMHTMCELPSDMHNAIVSRAWGLSPRLLSHSSLLGCHSPCLFPPVPGSTDVVLSKTLWQNSPIAILEDTTSLCNPCHPCTHSSLAQTFNRVS